MPCDIKMHQPTPAVGQHNEHEQNSKGRGRYREEIQRDQIWGVVLQECSPRLRRRPPRPDHVLRHRRLRESQAELQQLAVDPRRTPQRIRAAHLPYQIPQVPPNRGPTPTASTLPCPVEPEAPAVPPHHGLGPYHLQGTPPISRVSTTRSRRSDSSPSAAAVADALSTRRVAALARDSPAPTRGACEPRSGMSEEGSQAI